MTGADLRFDDRGLITAVVQDARTAQVLMVAWMNAEALALTRATGEAHFWSRSRQALWHKGGTSGNVQRVVELRVDCDGDTLLLLVEPAGPACHTGQVSCFYRTWPAQDGDLPSPAGAVDSRTPPASQPAMENEMADRIDELFAVIRDRKANPRPGSYTNALLSDQDENLKKIGEEAIEVVLAAKSQGDQRLLEETADLIYHTLVLLAARDLTWSDVTAELARRRR